MRKLFVVAVLAISAYAANAAWQVAGNALSALLATNQLRAAVAGEVN